MTRPTPSCPYCNALVPLPAGIVPQRITCPRCGEPFVPHTPEAMGIGDWAAEAGTASPEQVPRATAKRWSNRAIGWTVFGGMVVMATVGLIFALATQSER